MRGRVVCTYRGGPWDGKVEEVPTIYCQQTVGVRDEAWIAEADNGTAVIYRGAIGTQWTSLLLHIYSKEPQRPGTTGVTYRFVDSIDVHRCAQILSGQGGRRCKNEAVAGSTLCRQHEKMRARALAAQSRATHSWR